MANKNIYSRMQQKHDIQANWEKAVNFIPLEGEIIVYDPDENNSNSRIKIGDGKTKINDLLFVDNIKAVSYEEQTLTDNQQAQTRDNIGLGMFNVTDTQRDIYVDMYGIKRGSAEHAAQNSQIMESLFKYRSHGFTFHFGSGHYYFEKPIIRDKYTVFKGVCRDACVYSNPNVNVDPNYGTYLHFPSLADGEAGVDLLGGVIENLEVVGNPSICDVSLDRSKTMTDPNSVVSLVDNGTTYGIKVQGNCTIYNVKARNCTYGVYVESTNALLGNIDILRCKIGVSIGNDIKINNVQVWNVMVGVELRGQLASATNIRGDSIGKHLIECKRGRCILSNIDGDYCLGSLVHYGGDDLKMIHLGQATTCIGRVAAKYAYPLDGTFDLRNVPEADYEYCSYFSVAPNTSVFGGMLDVVNVSASVLDPEDRYVHPNAVISIGTGSTVKGLIVKCNVPEDADAEYLNKNVIKNLSNYAESTNDNHTYITDFDGITIEDIGFITPYGFVRSRRTRYELDRKIVTTDENLKAVSNMVETVGVTIPSINICDGVYEYGRFASAGTEYSDPQAFRTKNYIPVEGGRTITCWFAKADWNRNDLGWSVQIVQYASDKTILVQRSDMYSYAISNSSFTLDANTAYVRFSVYPVQSFSTPLSDIEFAVYYIEDAILGYVPPEPTIVGDKQVLNLENAVIPSSTEGSTKRFKLTIDDTGTLSVMEI